MSEKTFNNVKITSSFEVPEAKENLVSGETIGKHFGKIAKHMGDESIHHTVDSELSDTSTNPVQNKAVKAELDKKADKTDIPTSLPANGGNADTVGGIGIAGLRQITQTVLNTLPSVPNGEGDYFVNCDMSDTTFPYWYGYLSVRYGSYTGEYVATFRTTGNDNKVYYNTYLTNHWYGWQEIYTSNNKPLVTGTFTVNVSDTEQIISVPLMFNPSAVLLFHSQSTVTVPKQRILIALSSTEYKIKIGVPSSGDLSVLSTGFEAIINSWKGTTSTIDYIAYK